MSPSTRTSFRPGTEPVDGTKYDLRKDTLLTEQPFDDAWTDLEHAEDGTVTAVFTRPDGKKVRVGGDETVTSFQVCTGTGFPAIKHPGRRGGGTADGHTRTRSTPARTSSSSSRARRQARRCSSGCSTDIITIGISPGHTADAEFGKRLARVR